MGKTLVENNSLKLAFENLCVPKKFGNLILTDWQFSHDFKKLFYPVLSIFGQLQYEFVLQKTYANHVQRFYLK